MGSSSSCSTNNNNTDDSTLETNERFNFRFTDCSCQCNASKKHAKDISGQNDIPQIVFLQALMTQISRPQYDIRKLFFILSEVKSIFTRELFFRM